MSDPVSDSSIEEKNELIGQQLISLIKEVHQDMRPFVLIFPSPDQQGLQSFTNITSLRNLRLVLRDHLRMTKAAEEAELVTVQPATVQ